MRNITRRILLPLILFSSFFGFGKLAIASPEPPVVAGEGMMLMDAETGKIIASKNANMKLPPASTTKVLTALLTLENSKLSDIVTVGKNPPFAEGSSIALKEGDQYTVEELLHGLLLESANDCAVALAEHIAGTEENFVKMMNEKAKSLGANNTHFVNSSGLFEDEHLTTPYDLALIMKEVSKNKDFIRISRVTSCELPVSKVDNQSKWVNNINSLLYPTSSNYYEPLIAGKTGYTTKSRFTYTAIAKKNGQKLILTIFRYEDKASLFKDTIDLFNYGFDNFNLIKLYNKGDKVSTFKINEKKEIPLLASTDVFYVSESNKLNQSSSKSDIENTLKPSIKIEKKDLSRQTVNKGDVILNSEIYIGNSSYTSLPLVSGATVEYSTFNKILNNISDNKVIYSIVSLIIIILLFFLFKPTKPSGLFGRRNTKRFSIRFRRKRTPKQLFGGRKNKYD